MKDISKLLRNRLGELLGITPAPIVIAAGQFTEDEVVILKAVAGKLKNNAAIAAKPKVKKAPGLKKVSVADVEGPRAISPTPVSPLKPPKPAPGTIIAKGGKAGAAKEGIQEAYY